MLLFSVLAGLVVGIPCGVAVSIAVAFAFVVVVGGGGGGGRGRGGRGRGRGGRGRGRGGGGGGGGEVVLVFCMCVCGVYVLLFCVFPCHHECGILKNITVEWMFYVFNGLRFSFMDFYTYTNKKKRGYLQRARHDF